MDRHSDQGEGGGFPSESPQSPTTIGSGNRQPNTRLLDHCNGHHGRPDPPSAPLIPIPVAPSSQMEPLGWRPSYPSSVEDASSTNFDIAAVAEANSSASTSAGIASQLPEDDYKREEGPRLKGGTIIAGSDNDEFGMADDMFPLHPPPSAPKMEEVLILKVENHQKTPALFESYAYVEHPAKVNLRQVIEETVKVKWVVTKTIRSFCAEENILQVYHCIRDKEICLIQMLDIPVSRLLSLVHPDPTPPPPEVRVIIDVQEEEATISVEVEPKFSVSNNEEHDADEKDERDETKEEETTEPSASSSTGSHDILGGLIKEDLKKSNEHIDIQFELLKVLEEMARRGTDSMPLVPYELISQEKGEYTNSGLATATPALPVMKIPVAPRTTASPRTHPQDTPTPFDRRGRVMEPEEQIDMWSRKGLCVQCGQVKTHKVYFRGGMKIPLTVPNLVHKGVCLKCNPLGNFFNDFNNDGDDDPDNDDDEDPSSGGYNGGEGGGRGPSQHRGGSGRPHFGGSPQITNLGSHGHHRGQRRDLGNRGEEEPDLDQDNTFLVGPLNNISLRAMIAEIFNEIYSLSNADGRAGTSDAGGEIVIEAVVADIAVDGIDAIDILDLPLSVWWSPSDPNAIGLYVSATIWTDGVIGMNSRLGDTKIDNLVASPSSVQSDPVLSEGMSAAQLGSQNSAPHRLAPAPASQVTYSYQSAGGSRAEHTPTNARHHSSLPLRRTKTTEPLNAPPPPPMSLDGVEGDCDLRFPPPPPAAGGSLSSDDDNEKEVWHEERLRASLAAERGRRLAAEAAGDQERLRASPALMLLAKKSKQYRRRVFVLRGAKAESGSGEFTMMKQSVEIKPGGGDASWAAAAVAAPRDDEGDKQRQRERGRWRREVPRRAPGEAIGHVQFEASKRPVLGRKQDNSTTNKTPVFEDLIEGASLTTRKVHEHRCGDSDGVYGFYTGNIATLHTGTTDERDAPHGRGEMAYDDGTIMAGVWSKGELQLEVPPDGERHVPRVLSGYKVGDTGHRDDMTRSNAAAVGRLHVGDAAFILLSDPEKRWSYAIVKSRADGGDVSINFQVNARNSTKTISAAKWSDHVRIPKMAGGESSEDDSIDEIGWLSSSSTSSSTANKKSQKRVIDESVAVEPTDGDVFFGRGGFTITHPGNIKFRAKVRELRPWYERPTTTKEEKYQISDVLVESVRGCGHRFLEQGSDGKWHEVIGNRAREKASQALREGTRGQRSPALSRFDLADLQDVSSQAKAPQPPGSSSMAVAAGKNDTTSDGRRGGRRRAVLSPGDDAEEEGEGFMIAAAVDAPGRSLR